MNEQQFDAIVAWCYGGPFMDDDDWPRFVLWFVFIGLWLGAIVAAALLLFVIGHGAYSALRKVVQSAQT